MNNSGLVEVVNESIKNQYQVLVDYDWNLIAMYELEKTYRIMWISGKNS